MNVEFPEFYGLSANDTGIGTRPLCTVSGAGVVINVIGRLVVLLTFYFRGAYGVYLNITHDCAYPTTITAIMSIKSRDDANNHNHLV